MLTTAPISGTSDEFWALQTNFRSSMLISLHGSMSTTTISPVITPYVSLRIHPKYATSRSLTEIIFHSRKGTVFPTRDSGHWIWVTLVNRFSSDSACTDRLRSRSSITHEKGHACLLGSAVSDVLSPLWTQSHMNLKITFSFSISTAEIVEVS